MAAEKVEEVVTVNRTEPCNGQSTITTQVFVRKQKTLIVGQKKGVTAFLARCAVIAILFIRATAPLSVAFFTFHVARAVSTRRAIWMSSKRWKKLLAASMTMETFFFFYMQGKKIMLQKVQSERIPALSLVERRVLFERCIKSTPSVKHFLESWFEPVVPYDQLKRENVEELLAWAMFHKSEWKHCNMTPEEYTQLQDFVRHVESTGGHIQPGYNPTAKMLKFTDEKVEGKHRPLFMYLVVHALFQVVMAPAQMRWNSYQCFQEGSLTYWYRPGKNPRLPPICFVHGIGIGILPYQNWFRVIEKYCDAETGGLAGRGILIPEIHVISQRLNPCELHCDRFVPDLKRALFKSSGHDRACFAGHSYGSFCVSWLIKKAPDMVGAVGLIDPASVLLHNTEVLHNIVYHRARPNAIETVLDYIMRSEVSLVHNLKREFYWFQNILFFEEIDTIQCPVFVCLADTDQLVPIEEIKQYIANYNSGRFIDVADAPHKPAAPIELVWFDRCDHAGYLFNKTFERETAEAIDRICARSPRMAAT